MEIRQLSSDLGTRNEADFLQVGERLFVAGIRRGVFNGNRSYQRYGFGTNRRRVLSLRRDRVEMND